MFDVWHECNGCEKVIIEFVLSTSWFLFEFDCFCSPGFNFEQSRQCLVSTTKYQIISVIYWLQFFFIYFC